MRNPVRVLVPRGAGRLRAGAVKTLRPAGMFAARPARALWRQRFHWPVATLGLVMLSAAVVGPFMSTPSASHPVHKTEPASAWPGLVHQKQSAPALASTPDDLVPACAGSVGPAAEETAYLERHPSRLSSEGHSRVVLASLITSPPVVTSVSPDSGPLTGGTAVVIDGSGLTGATLVTFGVVPALFTVVSDTEITATSPPGVGTVDVRVVDLGGPSATSSADQFTYQAPLPSLPSLPTIPGAPSNPVTGGGGTSASSGSGSSSSSSSTGAAGTTGTPGSGTLPGTSALGLSGGSTLPTYGYGSDGDLGCALISNQTGQPTAGETPAQERAVQLALSFIGTPYVWGGESTHGFDCSGLVQFVYAAAGVQLPRTAQEQYDTGPAVAPGQTVVPGDLVFFGTGPDDVTHVGIFVGNGVMVDAPHTGADVRLDQINGFEPIVGVTAPGS